MMKSSLLSQHGYRILQNVIPRMVVISYHMHMNNNELRPTVWRTARALANKNRLLLLREVWMAKGSLSVTDLSRRVGMAVPTASQYLRAMNARGLISVGRNASYVYYADGKDRSLPEAQAIQDALSSLFSRKRLPVDWTQPVLSLLRAYSHFRRIDIIRSLASCGNAGFNDISRNTSIPKMSLARHLKVLLSAQVVARDVGGGYSLCKPQDEVASALLGVTVHGSLEGIAFCKM